MQREHLSTSSHSHEFCVLQVVSIYTGEKIVRQEIKLYPEHNIGMSNQRRNQNRQENRICLRFAANSGSTAAIQ